MQNRPIRGARHCIMVVMNFQLVVQSALSFLRFSLVKYTDFAKFLDFGESDTWIYYPEKFCRGRWVYSCFYSSNTITQLFSCVRDVGWTKLMKYSYYELTKVSCYAILIVSNSQLNNEHLLEVGIFSQKISLKLINFSLGLHQMKVT